MPAAAPGAAMIMIALDSVTKRYGSKTIIHGMSFAVETNEIVGFLGPNGAGKTTTLRMIAGFTAATSGTVTVAGHDMAVGNLEAARRIGYLPEHPPLYDTLDVAGYLGFVARAKGIPRARAAGEIDRVAAACRLEDMLRREIFKLSKGYRQRVGLAQALLGNPDVLLLDEPTIGLDPGQILETREAIRAFGAGRAVLLSTHILPEVTLVCRRVAIVNRGRLLAIDTPRGLQRAVEETSVVSLRLAAPADGARDALLAVDGVRGADTAPAESAANAVALDCAVEDRDGIEAQIARALAARWELLELRRRAPTLENIFLHYIRAAESGEAAA